MRIAIDARMHLKRPTGIGKYTFNLIKHLSVIDRTNDYLVLTNDRKIIEMPEMGVNIRIREIKPRPMSLSEQFALPWILKKDNIELFHALSFVVPGISATKTIITLHDLTHVFYKKEFSPVVQIYYKFVLKPVVKKAKIIITDSESSKRDIMNWADIDETRIRVTSLAAEGDYKPIKDKNALEQIKLKYKIGNKYILYNGNKKPHKNVESLIESFYLLRNNNKINCALVIVGKRDDKVSETNYSKLDSKISSLNMRNDIIYTGYVNDSDLALLYNAARSVYFSFSI